MMQKYLDRGRVRMNESQIMMQYLKALQKTIDFF